MSINNLMSSLTVADALALLARAVDEKGGNYIYKPDKAEGCRYADYADDREDAPLVPGCIVGHVLYYLGVPLGDFRDIEGLRAFRLARDKYGAGVDVAEVLEVAQIRQDDGATWREALAAAKCAVTQGSAT